jgi:hypothetical protein
MIDMVLAGARAFMPVLQNASDGTVIGLIAGAVLLMVYGTWDTLRRW